MQTLLSSIGFSYFCLQSTLLTSSSYLHKVCPETSNSVCLVQPPSLIRYLCCYKLSKSIKQKCKTNHIEKCSVGPQMDSHTLPADNLFSPHIWPVECLQRCRNNCRPAAKTASCMKIVELRPFYENNQASQAIIFNKSFWPTHNSSSACRQAKLSQFKTSECKTSEFKSECLNSRHLNSRCLGSICLNSRHLNSKHLDYILDWPGWQWFKVLNI